MAASHASVKGRKPTMFYDRNNKKVTFPQGSGGYENHHILPCTSVKKSLAAASKPNPNIRPAVVYFTDWNINKHSSTPPDVSNSAMLPTFKMYQNLYGTKGNKQGPIAPPAGMVGRPCHNRGHPTYNDNAQAALMSVWSKVVPKIDSHNTMTGANDVASDLDGKIKTFATKVASRATTHANWKALVQQGSAAAMQAFYMAT